MVPMTRYKEIEIKMDSIYVNNNEIPVTAFEYSRGKNVENEDQSEYDIVRITLPSLLDEETYNSMKENGFTHKMDKYDGYTDLWGCTVTLAKKVPIDDELTAIKTEIKDIYSVLEGKSTASPGSVIGIVRYILDSFITSAAKSGKNMLPYISIVKEWMPNTFYSKDDICKYRGMFYRCTTSHTSGSWADLEKWAGPYGTTIKYD